MTDREIKSVAFLGLPEAGKSTYISALYQSCIAHQNGAAIVHLGDSQREYLNQLGHTLASFSSLTRTKQSEPGELDLSVCLGTGQSDIDLRIPDLSGEHLRNALGGEKSLDPALFELASTLESAALFVNVRKIQPADGLADFQKLLEGLVVPEEGTTAPDRPEDWTVSLAATQSKLAHAVQEIVRLRDGRPLRLALVLSAWEEESASPSDWAGSHLCLLIQLLENCSSVTWRVFGASAQGGDFDNPEDVARLKAVTLSERPRVYDQHGVLTSVAAPVVWALDNAQ